MNLFKQKNNQDQIVCQLFLRLDVNLGEESCRSLGIFTKKKPKIATKVKYMYI